MPFDAAMGLARALRKKPRDIASDVLQHIEGHALLAGVEIAGPGFLNLTLSDEAIAAQINTLQTDERLGVAMPAAQRIVVDYSSPNVAKEMHVGHLRSTIIGDACVRLLEWLGHDVIRRNHVGDWGTPFGMLIEHLLDLGEATATDELSVGDLNGFYKKAREKFEADEAFQERARSRVVALQAGDEETLRLWKILIEQSQAYFMNVYVQMDVRLDGSEFVGESAYNDLLMPTLNELAAKQLIRKSDGADCVFPEGFTNRDGDPLPLIARKRDGGFGYAMTDLAAIRERRTDLKTDRILYVVGAPQSQHLEMIYTAARAANWVQEPSSAEHVAFGSVLGADGKMFKSRSGDAGKLADLLAEAVRRAGAILAEKNPDISGEERQQVADAVGIGALKYADLSSDRTRDYVFDFDRMLAFEGNTAPYIQYAHARIQAILRKAVAGSESTKAEPSELIAATTPIQLSSPTERALALKILAFSTVIYEVEASLNFHRLAAYLFELATSFSGFYNASRVLDAPDEGLRESRLVLCHLTARTLATGLNLLGIRAPKRM